jgi:hypothetical protein
MGGLDCFLCDSRVKIGTRGESRMGDRSQGRSRRWSMKTVVSFLVTVVLSCGLIGAAVAQQESPKDTLPPPRGVEGPEIRKEAPKGTRGADTPKAEKKSPRARDQKPKDTPPPPRGVEGPEMRKQAPKGTRAKSQQPRHTDSPPKVTGEPESKQDGGKKIQ